MGKTYYYRDLLRDDFAGTDIRQKTLPADYAYFPKTKGRRIAAFLVYHAVFPVVWLLQKIVYGEKIVGRKKLRPYRKTGFFLYGNHTRAMGDAFTPTLLARPRKAYILTSPDAVSLPFLRRLVEDLGALPLPTSLRGFRRFHDAVNEHARMGHVVTIYPEAHIWPCYTGIRPFPDDSFRYPAETGKPVFVFTVTYRRRWTGTAGTTVFVDGPFFPDETKTPKENRAALRACAYRAMTSHADQNTYRKNTFLPAEDGKRETEDPQPKENTD